MKEIDLDKQKVYEVDDMYFGSRNEALQYIKKKYKKYVVWDPKEAKRKQRKKKLDRIFNS